ncbi:MAG: hypothetical protein A2010_10325 [Nitrospirae bacterium GWD2_57_9]|nr:MAG: hypothetical protein A2010_10325 [Nitrospirae bacterium GWD2_57_9]OGW48833.1 MAG: hypothetical protein A2078_02885 [Nitrospirae bacterium GWC2_57_9]
METTTCAKKDCEQGQLERVRFFPRQLLTANDLQQEQGYLREKQRRHNRFLHGWGIVCGLDVKQPSASDPFKLTICSGYALSPQGDEIYVPAAAEFDLSQRCAGAEANANPCDKKADASAALKEKKVYVAVKYAECMTRPVRTLPNGCGCDEMACEYSRIKDGYEVACLDALPDAYFLQENKSESVTDLREALTKKDQALSCPECPHDPWVLLAVVTITKNSDEKRKAGSPPFEIGLTYEHRRILASSSML